MNPDLQKQLADLVTMGKDGTMQAVQFLKDHAPIFTQQIIRYEIWNDIWWIVCLSIISLMIWKLIRKYEKKECLDFSAARFFLLIPIVLSFVAVNALFKVLFAPELFLLEKVLSLVIEH